MAAPTRQSMTRWIRFCSCSALSATRPPSSARLNAEDRRRSRPTRGRFRSGTTGCGRAGSLGPVHEPGTDLLVDARVVEQVEVVQAAEAVHVVGREGQPVVVPRV